jgi:hypothetical protein
MVHALRTAMRLLRETGTDFAAAQSMGPREFFEVMGETSLVPSYLDSHSSLGLRDVVELDSKAGGTAFTSI